MLASKLALTEDQEKTLFLGYLAKGLSQRDIGKELGIPEYTISRKFKKYGLKKEKEIDDAIKDNLQQAKELAQVQNAENEERIIDENDDDLDASPESFEKALVSEIKANPNPKLFDTWLKYIMWKGGHTNNNFDEEEFVKNIVGEDNVNNDDDIPAP
jgi:transcriptional regulator with XRE-family HTH domain